MNFKMKPKCNITEIRSKKKGELSPVVVHFQNGDLKLNLPKLDVKLLPYDTQPDKNVEVSSPNGQLFTNSSITSIPQAIRFIAIRNKKTNKVKLVEVGFTTLINSRYLISETSVEEKEDQYEVKDLKKIFGTKKAIRNLQRREELNADTSNIDDEIKEILADAKVSEHDLSVKSEEGMSSKLIPPCNREANNLEEVYKVEDCLTSAELSTLSDAVLDVLKNKHNLDEKYSDYFKVHLKEALNHKDNLQARLGCLIYAEALNKYIKVPAKSILKMSSTMCPQSKTVSDKIMNEFCVKSGSSYLKPLIMKDKAVCYIMVLTLLATPYKVDLELLSKSTSFGFKKVKQLGRLVGIVPNKGNPNIYELHLPLPAPMNMVKRYRKKK